MKKDPFIDAIPDYLDGKLTDADKIKFEAHLKNNETLAKELEAYKTLFAAFKNEKPLHPSTKVKEGFLAILEEEKQNQVKVVSISHDGSRSNKHWFSNSFKIAASIAILVTSFFTGRYFEAKETQKQITLIENESLLIKQTAMISLMESQSASKRIQGVQYIEELPTLDEAIVNALTDRMLKDENTNVRLTAVEALSKFITSENVKDAFITALKSEKDPSIQITIIQILARIQEKKAVAPMQRLLEQEDTQPFIKDEINLVLPKII